MEGLQLNHASKPGPGYISRRIKGWFAMMLEYKNNSGILILCVVANTLFLISIWHSRDDNHLRAEVGNCGWLGNYNL